MRYLIAAAIVLLLITGLAGIKYKQISTLIRFGEAAQAAGPPPEAVGTAIAKTETWEGGISTVGNVAAARGVTITSEVPGVVKAIRFESGAKVRAGQVLMELDTTVERSQLASLQARFDLAQTNMERSRKLAQEQAITAAQVDNDQAQLKTVTADLAALRAQLAKKTIRAPFAGKLGIRAVNLGQYINAGTPVTVLESQGSLYVDFTLPQQHLPDVSVGTLVHVSNAVTGQQKQGEVTGKVAAVDPTIDPGTRTMKVRAEITNPEDRLRPGMFVNVKVVLPKQAPLVSVPATAVVRASYGNSIYIAEDKKTESGQVVKGPDGKPVKLARQQFVRLGPSRGDFVGIEDGLKEGEEVVTVGGFKLRNGAPIVINNSVKLNPSLAPQPENR